MIRKIIHIDEDKCSGCGLCAKACHEGAIDIINGKAKLTRENFCDGLGDCLPNCPTGAITFEEREAPEYDAVAVERAKVSREMMRQGIQWPLQVKLVPVNAAFFDGADVLLAADCTAYIYARMHDDFMAGRVTLIACPKLDGVDYSQKLGQIFAVNDVKSVTLVRMEVPCCGGLVRMTQEAIRLSGKEIPLEVVTVSR
ncbi:MAG: 4Fe-4S binding protein, partial [Synergistaceae bacterium]|nr:4Fe-4S binding protein [Synergistaceae bacterium]